MIGIPLSQAFPGILQDSKQSVQYLGELQNLSLRSKVRQQFIIMAKSQKKPVSGGKKPVSPRSNSTKKKIQTGIVHIRATFNNTLVTVTDPNGNVISWSSAGACGFKGARKSTPFAAQEAATAAVRQSVEQGLRRVEVMVSGPGSGRETALRAIQAAGIGITLIRDVTPIPHNGCRPPKKRRV